MTARTWTPCAPRSASGSPADGTFHGDFAGNGTAPWPRTLERVSPGILAIWQAYVGQARSAGLRARLYDLLTSAGFPPPYVHARKAIQAYREVVPGFLAVDETNRGRLRAVESLIRALGLAAQMNQRDLRDLVVSDILGLADGLLDADPVPSGTPLRVRLGRVSGTYTLDAWESAPPFSLALLDLANPSVPPTHCGKDLPSCRKVRIT